MKLWQQLLHIMFKEIYFQKVLSFRLLLVIFVDILRGQVAEVNLLQLIPGFYLILFLFLFLFSIFFKFINIHSFY